MGTDGDDGDDGLAWLVAEFLVESWEDLDTFEQDVVALEQDPACRDLSSSAFRTLHTLKGTSSSFGFGRLESLAHLGESVLARVRDGRAVCVPATATCLLRLSDTLRAMLAGIEEHGREPDLDTAAVEAGLRRCLAPRPTGQVLRHPVGETRVASGAVTSVRVEVAVLDGLVQLVGELDRTRDEIAPLLPPGTAARLDGVAGELRASLLRTRVEPVARAWSSLPRLVRDLSEASGKPVRLVTAGRDTPVDRVLLAAIRNPLTHLVRNAVDHGVECPRERRAVDKPLEATLTVRAYAAHDETVVEVSDDGRGIDLDRVRQTAVTHDVVPVDLLAAMTDDEVVALVLRPGFSTAAAVTGVSGRGVGLDVVRHDVEQVGGRVEIVSHPGLGCTVRLRLPHADGAGR